MRPCSTAYAHIHLHICAYRWHFGNIGQKSPTNRKCTLNGDFFNSSRRKGSGASIRKSEYLFFILNCSEWVVLSFADILLLGWIFVQKHLKPSACSKGLKTVCCFLNCLSKCLIIILELLNNNGKNSLWETKNPETVFFLQLAVINLKGSNMQMAFYSPLYNL